MSGHKSTRRYELTTGEEWSVLGFYHELDAEHNRWRLIGSRTGLLTLARMIHKYASGPPTSGERPPLEIGPFQDLKIREWETPGIDDESIYGPLQDLRRLAELIETRLAGTSPHSQVTIGPDYVPTAEYALRFEVMEDTFNAAAAVPAPVEHSDAPEAPESFSLPPVPFKFHEPDGFLTESDGMVRFEDRSIVLQYQTRDAFIGAIKSDVQEVELLCDEIASIRFKRGMFGAKMAVHVHDMKTVGKLPGSKLGRFSLKFKRADRDDAEHLATFLQRQLDGEWEEG